MVESGTISTKCVYQLRSSAMKYLFRLAIPQHSMARVGLQSSIASMGGIRIYTLQRIRTQLIMQGCTFWVIFAVYLVLFAIDLPPVVKALRQLAGKIPPILTFLPVHLGVVPMVNLWLVCMN